MSHGNTLNRSLLGFWTYLMTDCVLFATLFATYAVMRGATNGGPNGAELFQLPFVLAETMILLTSSFTCALAILASVRGRHRMTLGLLTVTGLLGAAFVGMELYEFIKLIQEGHSWRTSGFLSSYFTLVGTHGLHIVIGLIWLVVLLTQLVRRGFGGSSVKRLQLFSLFWHFLDVIWIFIFSIVYLWGSRV